MAQADTNKITADPDERSLKDTILRLREWRKYLRSKWLPLLIAALIGAGLGLTYSFLKKPLYTAELSFAVQDDSSPAGKLGAAAGLASQFGIDLGGANAGGAFSGDNLLELMRSRSMVEGALLSAVPINGKQQTLADLYVSFNHFGAAWAADPKLKDIAFLPGADRSKFSLQQDSLLGDFYDRIMKKNLSVEKTDKELNIIHVTVLSKNELFSKFFAEILVKEVSDFYIDTKTKKSAQNVNVLQKLADSVRQELNSAITGVASTSDNIPNANPALQILKVPSLHHQVDVEANGAMLTEIVKNLELAKISLRKETPLVQVIDRPILPLDEKEVKKPIGFIAGAVIGALVMAVWLIVRKRYKEIMSADQA